MEIRSLALSLVADVPGHKNWTAQIKAIHAFVQYSIQYVRDVRGVETLARFVALRLAVIDLMADTEKDLQDEPGESSLPESDAVAGVDTETPTSDSTSDSDTPINP